MQIGTVAPFGNQQGTAMFPNKWDVRSGGRFLWARPGKESDQLLLVVEEEIELREKVRAENPAELGVQGSNRFGTIDKHLEIASGDGSESDRGQEGSGKCFLSIRGIQRELVGGAQLQVMCQGRINERSFGSGVQ